MEQAHEMETRIWEYIDGSCPQEEASAVALLVKENSDWRAKYQELLAVHHSLNLTELEHPSLRFTKNVMEEIAKLQIAPATKKYINNKIIWSIGAFFILMILGFIIYGIAQIDWTSANNSNATLGIDWNKIDYSRMFNSTLMNVLMMVNVLLGLFFLDRYLSNKRKEQSSGSL